MLLKQAGAEGIAKLAACRRSTRLCAFGWGGRFALEEVIAGAAIGFIFCCHMGIS